MSLLRRNLTPGMALLEKSIVPDRSLDPTTDLVASLMALHVSARRLTKRNDVPSDLKKLQQFVYYVLRSFFWQKVTAIEGLPFTEAAEFSRQIASMSHKMPTVPFPPHKV
jgi:hypothetical protein